jgi:hypothetical protein
MFDVDIDIAQPKDFIGFFPFERTRVHPFIPLACLRLWRDFDWSFRSTPLVRTGKIERCIEILAHWLATDPKIPGLVDFNGLVGPSALGQALTHWLSKDQRFCHFLKASSSHLFHCKETAEAYFSCVLSKKRQDDFRRKRRQLEALGPVRFVDVDDCDDIHAFVDEFLELEARGWKGKSGTAMIALKDGAKTARALLLEAHRRNRLSILGMRIGNKLVAARSVILTPPGAFGFKRAHDEDGRWARCSPGYLLEIEGIRRLHNDLDRLGAGIEWIDTCSSPDAELSRVFRSEAITIDRHVVAVRARPISLLVRLLPYAISLLTWYRSHRRIYSAFSRKSGSSWHQEGKTTTLL